MYVSIYVCMIVCFPLQCPGPGYGLLSRRVVPPPQSDHREQLLSGESSHTIRHEKEHHIVRVSHTNANLYTHTVWAKQITQNAYFNHISSPM